VISLLREFTSLTTNSVPGVIKQGKKYYCNRCGNKKLKDFYRDSLGVYCRNCLVFGKSATYTKIIREQIIIPKKDKCGLTKVIHLSDMQELASKHCVKAYKEGKNTLIYAVCGAGKTEIVYEVILTALNEGKVVGFATPRKDVVLELYPRFKRDFCQVEIVALYGGSQDKGRLANLYITTTHQLINFYQFFDLIILDEVDAFPYYNNKMLEGFVQKAKKKKAPIIFLTATPTRKIQYLMKTKQLDYFIIPLRFHRYPIPVPRVSLTSATITKLNKGVCPKKILNWLESKKSTSKQVFVFVPDIKSGINLEKILKPHFTCAFVYAESPNRKQIINDFRAGKFQLIITTTILERGVTVSNVDVCIVGCDAEIFDERAIVQIVGRAGRDKNYPTADVVLFCDYYTREIRKAIKQIKRMNKMAKRMKLLL